MYWISSCQKNNEMQTPDTENTVVENNAIEASASESEGMIKLGKKLENPYSVANMRKAAENLKKKSDDIKATHLYLKFLPQTINEAMSLKSDTNLILFDYPLDYEILEEGNYYVDPESSVASLTYLYAVISIDDEIPDYTYEILEYLHKPSENEYDIEDESINLTNYPCSNLSKKMREKYNPTGYIKIINGNNSLPVQNIRLRVGRSFWWYEPTTNDKGYFYVGDTYRHEVGVYVQHRSSIANIRRTVTEVMGVAVRDKFCNVNSGNTGSSFFISPSSDTDSHRWKKLAVHNAIREYNKYAAKYNIIKVSDINVWMLKSKISASSAPLFHKSGTTSTAFNQWINLFFFPIDVTVSAMAGHLYPDIIINDNLSTSDVQSIYSHVFHELSHYSHAMKAGISMWSNVVREEATNQTKYGTPYGDGTAPTELRAQYIAFAEAWAGFMQYRMLKDHFGGYSLESFKPYSIPYQTEKTYGWTPYGLFWDVEDRTTDIVEYKNSSGTVLVSGTDYVTNIDIDQMYNLLPGCTTMSHFKPKLQQKFPRLSTDINNLFSYYGY